MNQFILKVMGVLCILASSYASALSQTPESFQDRIRVKLSETSGINIQSLSKDANGIAKTGIQSIDQLNESYGVERMSRVFPYAGKFEEKHQKYGLHLWYDIYIDKSKSVRSTISGYGQLKEVEIAQPVYQYKLDVVGEALEVDDPSYNDQWHYDNTGQTEGTEGADINLQQAWNLETGDNNVVVSVHDSGIDTDHPDLVDVLWTNTGEVPGNGIDDDNNGYIDDVHGFNFWNSTGDVEDFNGHGSHTAGTIAAKNNNGYGVSGIAGGTSANDGVRVMMMRLGDNNGSPYIFNPAPSFVYAADMGATISSNSWGGGSYDQAVVDAINYFVAEAKNSTMDGGLVIFSAGNSSSSYPDYKSDLDNVLMVAASNHDDQKAWYSNYGDWIDLTAPGGETNSLSREGVLSTVPGGGSAFYQGTSMACPHVSGVAALVASYQSGLSNSELSEILISSTDSIDHVNPNYNGLLGSGRIDALLALNNVNGIGIVEKLDITPGSYSLELEQGITQEYISKIVNSSNVDLAIAISTNEEWIILDEDSITLRKGEVYNLNFTVSTVQLAEGDALSGNVEFRFGETAEILPVDLYVTGNPQVSAIDTLNFGLVYPNTSVNKVLEIQNIGFSDLVIDSIKIEGEFFSTIDTSYIVARESSIFHEIEYSPFNSDTATASLIIYSQEPAQTQYSVTLFGVGNPNNPPKVSFSETEIVIEDSYQRYGSYPFEITNTGDEDLYVSLSNKLLINDLPDTILNTEEVQDYQYVTSISDELDFNWLDISAVGDSIHFSSNDEYLKLDLENPILFDDDFRNQITITSKGYLTFSDNTNATDVGNLRWNGPDLSILPLWSNYTLDENSVVYYLELDDKLIVQYQNYGVNDYTFQVIIFSEGNIRFQYLEIPEDSYQTVSVGLRGDGDYRSITYSYGSSRYVVEENLAIHFNTGSAIRYFSPNSATIDPGYTRTFYINYNGYGVTPGVEHESKIIIANNSVEPTIELPFKLRVNGTASIQAPTELDLGIKFIGNDTQEYFAIKNTGTDTLTIDSITNSNSSIGIEDFDKTLLRGEERLIGIDINTVAIDSLFDTLTVYSNANYQPVINIPVRITIQNPPEISLSDNEITAEIYHGEVFNKDLIISNSRDTSTLNFELESFWIDSLGNPLGNSIEGISVAVPSDYDYYELRADLIDLGADVKTINYYNFDITDLNGVDIWISDYNIRSRSSEEIKQISNWIEAGGTFIVLLDDRGEINQVSGIIEGSGVTLYDGIYFNGNITNLSDHFINSGVSSLNAGSWRNYTAVTGDAKIVAGNIYTLGFASYGPKGRGHVMVISDDIVDYSYSGSNKRFMENSIVWFTRQHLNFEPASGIIENIGEQSVSISFDSKSISESDTVKWLLTLDHNDPNADQFEIPVNITVLDAGFLSSDTVLQFENTFVGTESTLDIQIKNDGSDTLSITGISLTGNEQISIDDINMSYPFDLNPDSTINIIGLFNAISVDTVAAELIIKSNSKSDSEYTIQLNAIGIESSIINSNSDVVSKTLNIGDAGQETLILSSVGTDSVEFFLKIVDPQITNVINGIENRILASSKGKSFQLEDFQGQQFTSVIDESTNLAGVRINSSPDGLGDVVILGASPFVSNVADSVNTHGNFNTVSYVDVRYTTPTIDELSVFDAALVYLNYGYHNSTELGNVLAQYVDMGRGVVSAVFETSLSHLAGDWQTGNYRVINAGRRSSWSQVSSFGSHPVTDGISFLVGYYRTSTNSLVDNGNVISYWNDGSILAGEKNVGTSKRVDLGLYPDDVFYNYFNGYEGFDLIANSLKHVGVFDSTSEVSWAELEFHSGSLASGESTNITVDFTAEDLAEGSYNAAINIQSTDSRRFSQQVPISLTVVGIPNLEYDEALDFGKVTLGFESSITEFDIFNSGTGKIGIDSIYTNDTTFTVYNPVSSGYYINPGKTLKLAIAFEPTVVGESTSELIIITEEADTLSISLTGEGLVPGQINIDPDSLSIVTNYQESAETSFEISNTGSGILKFELGEYSDRETVQFESGPAIKKGQSDLRIGMNQVLSNSNFDSFGYTYVDSDSSVLDFSWEDISSSGTELILSDDDFSKLELPFEFKLYGQRFSNLYVGSNGLISINPELANSPSYTSLPNQNYPDGIIAPFWTDLNPENGGNIYYEITNDDVTVQFVNVPNFSGNSTYTFEVTLKSDGNIKFQYLSIEGESNGVTGIESANGTDGFTLAFNGDYLKDNFAIEIIHPVEFISPNITSGTLNPGESQTIELTINPGDRYGGLYEEVLSVSSNDTSSRSLEIPILIEIEGTPGIQLDTAFVSFDSTYVNGMGVKYLGLRNDGTDLLEIDGYSSDNPSFYPTKGYFSIEDSVATSYILLNVSKMYFEAVFPELDIEVDYMEVDFNGSRKPVKFSSTDTTYVVNVSLNLNSSEIANLILGQASLIVYDRNLNVIESYAIKESTTYLRPNYYTQFKVFFIPTEEGSQNGRITINSNTGQVENELQVSGITKTTSRELTLSVVNISEILHVGDSTEYTFTIQNTGSETVDYGFRTALKRSPNVSGSNTGNTVNSDLNSSFHSKWNPTLYQQTTTDLPNNIASYAYGGYYDYNNGSYSHVYFDVNDPSSITAISDFSLSGFSNSGDFIRVNDTPYLIEMTNDGELVELNLITGDYTITQTNIYGMTGMTVDPTSEMIYLTDGDELFLFDLYTRESNLIGAFNTTYYIIDIAMNANGQIFGFDYLTDELFEIDPITGNATVVGSIGFNSSFGQGMAYDMNSDEFYLSAFNRTTFRPEIRRVDITTGSTELISSFPPNTQMGWMAFPNNSKPIIQVTSNQDSLAAGEIDTVLVKINASDLYNGTYLFDLFVNSNDQVNPSQSIEVELEVYGNEASYDIQDEEVEFGNVKIKETSDEYFVVSNNSNAILELSVTSNSEIFSFSNDTIEIGVGNEAQIEVGFTPQTTGTLEDYIYIHSNDPQVPLDSILVRGTGVRGSTRLALSSESFEFDLWKTECDTAELNIVNIGEDSVYWSISILDSASWFSLSTSADSLISNESSNIEVTYCDLGDSTATYSSNLLFTSNDPLYDSIVIPITLNVTNRVPYFVELPTDQIIDLRDTLAYHFYDLVYDEDADDLTFEIVIENDTITNYTLTDSVLTLVGNRSGDSRVDINVNDGEDSISVSFNVRVNAIPLYSSMLHPIEMPINSQMVINLEDYFTDLEGDELTYGVTTNEEMVTLLMTQTNELIIQSSESIGTDNLNIIVSDYRSEIEISTEISIYKPLSADDSDSEGISIYPIPTNDYLNIEIDNSEHFIQEVNLTDLTGKVVDVSFRNFESNLIVDMKSLKGGVYLLNINLEGDKKITTRIIKE